jgi:hypothetical protein
MMANHPYLPHYSSFYPLGGANDTKGVHDWGQTIWVFKSHLVNIQVFNAKLFNTSAIITIKHLERVCTERGEAFESDKYCMYVPELNFVQCVHFPTDITTKLEQQSGFKRYSVE